MGQAIGEILPLAVGVAISPVPIIAIVLILGTPRARSNGPAFALGWIAGLTIVGGVLLALANGNSQADDGGPETWVSIVKLALGVLFVLVAARTWHTRPRAGREAAMPKWMQAIDTFTAGKSLGFGAILSGVNPKNLALTIAAATAIAQTGSSGGEAAVALAVFILVGSLSIIAPVGISFAMGAKGAVVLEEIKQWMAAHNAAIMTVLLLVLGVKLIGDAIGGLGS
jgi:threonine/homoserine/homoserine lactone efflux protein